MACSTLVSGITFNPCAKSMGGVKFVYLANYDDIDWFDSEQTGDGNFTEDNANFFDADGRLIKIPMKTGTTFYEFGIRKNTGSMTSTLNVDDNTGASVSTDLVMDWREMEYEKRKAMSAFLQGEFVGIVVDANNHTWFLGLNLAMTASAGTGETGTANTDANHYSITLNDVSNDWPHEVKTAPDEGEQNPVYVDISSLI